jgi:hypothetical protein
MKLVLALFALFAAGSCAAKRNDSAVKSAQPPSEGRYFQSLTEQLAFEVKKVSPGAKLFGFNYIFLGSSDEPSTEPNAVITGYFSTPADNINYLHARKYDITEVFPAPYSVARSSGGPQCTDCGKPTGQPESPDKHPDIQGWDATFEQIEASLHKIGAGFSLRERCQVHVTSVMRLQTFTWNFLPFFRQFRDIAKKLPAAPTSIIIVTRALPDSMAEYAILRASDGSIIASGSYKQIAPPTSIGVGN